MSDSLYQAQLEEDLLEAQISVRALYSELDLVYNYFHQRHSELYRSYLTELTARYTFPLTSAARRRLSRCRPSREFRAQTHLLEIEYRRITVGLRARLVQQLQLCDAISVLMD